MAGRSSLPTKLLDESSRKAESNHNQQLLAEEKDSGELEIKNVDAKPAEDGYVDTVAKLRKQSELFKLPMPSEKEAVSIKKIESEHERPPRKRKWISN